MSEHDKGDFVFIAKPNCTIGSQLLEQIIQCFTTHLALKLRDVDVRLSVERIVATKHVRSNVHICVGVV